jgi:phytoene desaturase
MEAEILATCGPRDAAAFGGFRAWLRELYEVELPGFIDRNYDSPLDLARPLGPAIRLARLGGFGRLAARIERTFTDERLRRLFGFQSLYAGLAPYQALALYGVITYMDSVEGVYYPPGGMHEVAVALADAATKAGAEIRYRAPVERIVLAAGSTGPVRGVELAGGDLLAADAVVCNVDLPVAYRTLLPGLGFPRAVRRTRYSPSAVVWHAGARGRPALDVAHHNIHFGAAWDGAFRALFDDGRRMPDPSTLVTVPSVTDPAVAPDGCTTLFGLEPVPNLDGTLDWSTERARARDDLATRLAGLGYPAEVEVEAFVDPRDWERAGMERGTPFAASHRFLQSGPFRPANVDGRAPGLVFVGSGTVPGVGVPMVLLSGRLAAERVRGARR